MHRPQPLRRQNRRGNYSLFMGVLIPVVFGFMALGLDISYVQLAQTQAQHVADAASHAAFVAWRASDDDVAYENAWAAAQYIVDSNSVGFGTADLDNVEIGGWDPEARDFSAARDYRNAARVQLSRAGGNSIELMMAPVIDKEAPDLFGSAVTAGRTREIMIAQDITGSYADDIDSARAANLAFLDYMIENPYPGDMIGMTVFVGGVEDVPWDPIDYIAGNEAEIYTRWAILESCNCAPLAWSNDDCLASYDGVWDADLFDECWEWFCEEYYLNVDEQPHMPDCHAVGTQTSPGPGIEQAVDQLVSIGNPTSFQAIIVNHDGVPCCGDVTAERTAATVAAVDRAWENGIHVWVVGFNEAGADFSFLDSLPRGQGTFYETPDPDDLTGIMIEIAASIPVTLVQ
ncbi:MAG: Flp pilus assembly protein TadG [Myxococcota bacterium]|jgi:Flp pilus assembly protein TadG